VVLWVMVHLMPRFNDIFEDFDARLPGATLVLISASDWLFAHRVAIAGALGAILLAGLALRLLGGAAGEDAPVARFVAWARWMLPFLRTLDYGLGMAKVIRSILLRIRGGAAEAFPAGLPAAVSPTNRLRRNLHRFVEGVADGRAPHQAASEAGLGDVFVCALRMVERGEDPERALAHAADYYEAVAYRWWHALVALAGPLVTVACGALVGFVVWSLFLPLVTLIDAVSGSL
jgi:type IV pilus assembly protein PilC